MNIYVNNKQQEIAADARINEALQSMNITAQKGIAIAVNNSVVPRGEWETFTLKKDDHITVIRATQGG